MSRSASFPREEILMSSPSNSTMAEREKKSNNDLRMENTGKWQIWCFLMLMLSILGSFRAEIYLLLTMCIHDASHDCLVYATFFWCVACAHPRILSWGARKMQYDGKRINACRYSVVNVHEKNGGKFQGCCTTKSVITPSFMIYLYCCTVTNMHVST